MGFAVAAAFQSAQKKKEIPHCAASVRNDGCLREV